jgi:hypothetical protein
VRTRVVLVAALCAVLGGSTHAASSANCTGSAIDATALTDLGSGLYHGYRGGLYPNGRNVPPKSWARKGLAAARRVRPIGGRVVLLSIGMSNAEMEWGAFMRLAASSPRVSPRVTLVDGAIPGQDALAIADPAAQYWSLVSARLRQAGVTARQVQAIWLKEAIADPTGPFPADALELRSLLRSIVTILHARFPNLRLLYVSSRSYGGYASSRLNPEPYAYESGFAVKWLVQDAIAGRIRGPWIGWGPYLWTDGTRGRDDGLVWTCGDVRPTDGTHLSPSGLEKISLLLFRFFTTDPTARRWFTQG